MSDKKHTRRSFFGHAGAALAAPLAATAAFAGERDGRGYVLGRRDAGEDSNAIRVLQQRYARLVGAGDRDAVAALFADSARATVGEHLRSVVIDGDDAIEISTAGTAIARVPCVATTATPIADGGTLVEMARLQGDGVVTRSERRVLVSELVKRDGHWRFVKVELEA
jgi:hypothetical protein